MPCGQLVRLPGQPNSHKDEPSDEDCKQDNGGDGGGHRLMFPEFTIITGCCLTIIQRIVHAPEVVAKSG